MGRVIKTRLIQRYPLPGVQRRIVKDETSPWSNKTESYSFENIVVGPAMVQMIEKEEVLVALQGNSVDTAFTIFSDTPVYAKIEGTAFVGTSIYIPDSYFSQDVNAPPEVQGKGGWFNVVQPHHRRNGVLEHTEAVLIRDTQATNVDGIQKYPDISPISSLLSTREQWQSGSWEGLWVGTTINTEGII